VRIGEVNRDKGGGNRLRLKRGELQTPPKRRFFMRLRRGTWEVPSNIGDREEDDLYSEHQDRKKKIL